MFQDAIQIDLAILLAVFLMLLLLVYRQRSSISKIKKAYAKRLKETQEHLDSYISDLDNLIIMLAEIHDFGVRASDISSREDLAKSVLNSACRLINSESGSLMLLDYSTGELVIVASKGIPSEVVKQIRLKLGEGIAGRVAQTGKPIFVDDVEKDSRFLRANIDNRYQSPSFISVPLKVRDKTIGVLNVNSPGKNSRFEERDTRLLGILADQAATIMENIELYSDIQDFYVEMIQTLARTIDAKDSYTHDHADRARTYARLICRKLDIPEQLTRHIEYAALMHDIGKIGIGEDILHKPGKLSNEEYEMIKKHPAIGHRILEPIAFLSPVAPMVLYHQEWYNGKGYPAGLSGEEIPLGSRIVAVIDAYDAMTSDRPYRKTLLKETAIAELKNCSGKQFDPKVVAVFIEILESEGAGKKTDTPVAS